MFSFLSFFLLSLYSVFLFCRFSSEVTTPLGHGLVRLYLLMSCRRLPKRKGVPSLPPVVSGAEASTSARTTHAHNISDFQFSLVIFELIIQRLLSVLFVYSSNFPWTVQLLYKYICIKNLFFLIIYNVYVYTCI